MKTVTLKANEVIIPKKHFNWLLAESRLLKKAVTTLDDVLDCNHRLGELSRPIAVEARNIIATAQKIKDARKGADCD